MFPINSPDIEESQEVSEQLEEYKSLFKKADTAVCILSADGHILEHNDAFTNLLGYANALFDEDFHPSMISPEFQPDGRRSVEKANDMLARADKLGKHSFEWMHKAEDGRELMSHVTLERITFRGEPALHSSIRDISEQKKLQRLVEERTAEIRRKKGNLKFSHELLISILCIAIMVVLAQQGLGVIEEKNRTATGHTLRTVLHTIEESVYLWSSNRINDVRQLASNSEVKSFTQKLLSFQHTKEELLTREKVQTKLRDELKAFLDVQGYQGFFVISPQFKNIGSMRDANVATQNLIANQRPELLERVFKGESLIIPPIKSDVALAVNDKLSRSSPATMFAASPIYDNNGKIIAALTLRIDPRRDFSSLMRLGRIGSSGESYAFDNQGRMLSESRFEDEIRNLGIIGVMEQSILNVKLTDPGLDLTKKVRTKKLSTSHPPTLMVKQALEHGRGADITGYRDYRGKMVLGAWTWDEKLGFGLASEIDLSEALQSYYITEKVIWFGLAVTGSLLFLITIYLSSRKEQALNNLSEYQSILENRVQERTENLLKVNTRLNEQVTERIRIEEQLKSTHAALEESNLKLQKLATIDSLTGVHNRRSFDKHLKEEWDRSRRQSNSLSLLLIDLDYFKLLNDSQGHQAGDDCLQNIGRILLNGGYARRPGDLISRYGGEEFAIILSDTDIHGANAIAEKVRLGILNAAIPHPTTKVRNSAVVSSSIGIAALIPPIGQSPELLIQLADKALYQAKDKGRNNVSISRHLNEVS